MVRKKMAVMGAQLRKTEESRRTYQVVTDKLLGKAITMGTLKLAVA